MKNITEELKAVGSLEGALDVDISFPKVTRGANLAGFGITPYTVEYGYMFPHVRGHMTDILKGYIKAWWLTTL